MQILISYNKVQLLSENYLVYMQSNSISITTLGTVSFTYVICDQTGKIFFSEYSMLMPLELVFLATGAKVDNRRGPAKYLKECFPYLTVLNRLRP